MQNEIRERVISNFSKLDLNRNIGNTQKKNNKLSFIFI